jgi:hypothetical protein
MLEHSSAALHPIVVIIQGTTVANDPEVFAIAYASPMSSPQVRVTSDEVDAPGARCRPRHVLHSPLR